jgi:carboxylesterase type B
LQAQSTLRNELLANPDPAFWGEAALTYLPWAPTVDGDVVPDAPIRRIYSGVAADIDLLVGSNLEETRLFLLAGGDMDRITEDGVTAIAAAYQLPKSGLEAYRAAYPGASAGELFSAIQTDWYWRLPALRMADAHAATARAATFMYEFAWRSPQFGGRLGAAHSVEIAFVFDTLGLGTEPILGSAPPQPLADDMHRAWTSFASSGECGWARYELTRRATMRFDVPPRVVDDPMAGRQAMWEEHR